MTVPKHTHTDLNRKHLLALNCGDSCGETATNLSSSPAPLSTAARELSPQVTQLPEAGPDEMRLSTQPGAGLDLSPDEIAVLRRKAKRAVLKRSPGVSWEALQSLIDSETERRALRYAKRKARGPRRQRRSGL